jgi:uncharacterized surface protein with fasciclin (FAS1) repeats
MMLITRAMASFAVAAPLLLSSVAAKAQDIVDTAVSAGSFNTLVAAVKAAGLVDTLKSKGPFTVFAPTDAAFKKLPAGTLENLLKPENKATLTAILTYHVLPGDYPAARITKSSVKQYGVKSVEGSNVKVDLRSGVKVSGATVTKTDIKTSNGTIHVIDSVILPPKVKAAMAAKAHSSKTAPKTAKAH